MRIQNNAIGQQTLAANKAKPDKETMKLAQTISDQIDKIEEIPDYQQRQEETLKLMVQAKGQTKDPKVKDLLRISEVAVHAKEIIYSTMKIAKITHQALINGCYGNAPLLAKTAGDMFDTLQFGPRKTVSKRLLKEMPRRTKDPMALNAYEMAKEIQGNVFSDYTGDKKISITKEVLSAVARGFTGSPTEVLQLGINLCHRGYGDQYEGRKLKPISSHLFSSIDNRNTKAKMKFAWTIADHMKGEQAEKFLSTMLEDAESIPAGDEGRLQIAGKAMKHFRSREKLSAASFDILKEFSTKTRDSNMKKIFSLAKKINRAIHPDLSEYYGEDENLPDTSDLVRTAVQFAGENKPLDSDKEILSYAADLIRPTQGASEETSNKICGLLINEVTNPHCKKILQFTSELSKDPDDTDMLLVGIEAAKEALEGKEVDLTKVGEKMAESFPSDYSRADTFNSLFNYMSKDPQYKNVNNMLKMGMAATKETYSGPGDKVRLSKRILEMIREGKTDKTIDPIEFTREISNLPSSAGNRFNVIEKTSKELYKQTKDPNVKEFLNLASEFVKDCADYDYSTRAFNKALDKAQELKTGKKFHLINDSLDVINSVPDKLIQANMLRNLDMKYCRELINEKKVSEVVEGPLEELSAMGETSSQRLQTSLDFLNILSRNSQTPMGAYDTLGEIYDRFPEKHRDIAALSFFHFVKSDPGSNNLDSIRNVYMKPESWKALSGTLDAVSNEKNDFTLIKDSILSMKDLPEDTPMGPMSFILLKEMEKRGEKNKKLLMIIDEYKGKCEKDEYRLSQRPPQDAVFEIAKMMINEVAKQNSMISTPVSYMNARWQEGRTDENRDLLIQTFEDIDKFQKGEVDSVIEWAAGKIFDDSGDNTGPKKEIVNQDDYVIIGGIILKKRK